MEKEDLKPCRNCGCKEIDGEDFNGCYCQKDN